MHKNFFRYSESFVSRAKRVTKKKRKVGLLRLLDIVCEELDKNYKSNQSVVVRVQKKLSELDLSLGRARIGDHMRLVQVTFQWLRADSKGKLELLKRLSGAKESKGSKEYFKFIRSGIECLFKDRISNLETLKRRAKKAEKNKQAALAHKADSQPVDNVVAESVVEIVDQEKPIENGCGEIINLVDGAHFAADKLVEIITTYDRCNKELRSDCLRYMNETQELKNQILILKSRELVLERNLEGFKQVAEVLEKKEKDAWACWAELDKKLEKANQDLQDKDIEIGLLKAELDRLQLLDALDLAFEVISREKAKRNHEAEQESKKPAVDPVASPAEEIQGSKIDDPSFLAYSSYFKRPVGYEEGFDQNLGDISTGHLKSIKRNIRRFLELGHNCKSNRRKKMKQGMYAGVKRLKAGPYRIPVEVQNDRIFISKPYKR